MLQRISLFLSLSVAQDLNYGQGSLSLSVTLILFDLDGLVSFPDFIAIYLLTLDFHQTSERERASKMAFMAVLESDLRALSAEARRRYPAVKDGAEHAILKVPAPFRPSHIHICFHCVCICMCVQLGMYVCMSW